MKTLKAIYDLFLFEDDLFWYEVEIIRNELCAGIGQNREAIKQVIRHRINLDTIY